MLRVLYILQISLLSDMWFAKILSQLACTLSFYLLPGSFHRAKVFVFIKSNLSNFPFIKHIFGIVSENLSALDLEDFLLFSRKCFILLHFTLKFINNFELIFI